VATHGERFAAHGKEGVDGSSPLQALKIPANRDFFSSVLHRTEAVDGLYVREQEAVKPIAIPTTAAAAPMTGVAGDCRGWKRPAWILR
jgi:hypothetical protein